MSMPDETIMAYVDGELDSAACAEVEAAIHNDPQVAKRVEQYRELRARLQAAYGPELSEPVPERLLSAVRRTDAPKPMRTPFSARRWRPAAALAASLLIGVVAGYVAWRPSDSLLIKSAGGAWVAGGALARSLQTQLAGEPSPNVTVGMSFVAKSGDYCRTFTVSGKSSAAGLACRHGRRWEIGLLTASPESDSGGQYRTAGSTLPAAVLGAVEQQMAGEPLDRAAEIAARSHDWQPSGR
jgi:hypothetical protein